MSPDDPRHGTYAGVKAHDKDHEHLCAPCDQIRFRYHKQMKIRVAAGVRNRIPLGRRAHAIISDLGGTQIAAATGLNRNMLYRLAAKGPDGIVLRRTRDAILLCEQSYTIAGVQRRVQSLMALGYSGTEIAEHVGSDRDSILRLAKREACFIRHDFALRIVNGYEDLSMTRPPASRTRSRMVADAQRKGYAPPLAWDDIDTDEAPAAPDQHRRDTLAEFEWLTSFGESDEQAARQLGITLDAIEMARIRARKDAA